MKIYINAVIMRFNLNKEWLLFGKGLQYNSKFAQLSCGSNCDECAEIQEKLKEMTQKVTLLEKLVSVLEENRQAK